MVKEAILKRASCDAFNSKIPDSLVPCRQSLDHCQRTCTACGQRRGEAGATDPEGDYYSFIWDTYTVGGSISVNAGAPSLNAGAYVGGFVGLNHGRIGGH